MHRLRNLLLVIALVGASMPLPAAPVVVCGPVLRTQEGSGCCGSDCRCARAGGCACSVRPPLPEPQPPQRQAADGPSGSVPNRTPLALLVYPTLFARPVLARALSTTAAPAATVAARTGRRLAFLGTLLI